MRSDRFRKMRGQIQMLSVGTGSSCSTEVVDALRQFQQVAWEDLDTVCRDGKQLVIAI